MRGKMLFVSIALLVMLFFVETASAQVNVATLEQLQNALAGNDEGDHRDPNHCNR